jgi:hypothetical protein
MGRFSSNDLEVNRIKAFVLVARQLWTVLVRKRVPKVLRIKSGLGSLICNSAHRLAFNRISGTFKGIWTDDLGGRSTDRCPHLSELGFLSVPDARTSTCKKKAFSCHKHDPGERRRMAMLPQTTKATA